jgi:hypothetical protein
MAKDPAPAGAAGGFVGTLASVLTSIVGTVINVAVEPVKKIIAGIASLITMWQFHATVSLYPKQAVKLAEIISKSYFALPDEWGGFVKGYLEQMTGDKIDVSRLIKQGAVPGSKEFMQSMGKTFLEPMLGLIMPGTGKFGKEMKITSEDGFNAASRFLGTNLQFQISAWLLHVLGDMQSFGAFKSLKDLPNAISWSYGIGWLSWLVMGVPFRLGISDPLERGYNATYRPKRPNATQVAKALAAGKIPKSMALEILSEEGWPNEWIDIILKQEREKIPKSDLDDLYEWGYMDAGDVAKALETVGYSKDISKEIATIMVNKRKRKLIGDVANVAEDLYIRDRLPESTLRGYYSQAGYNVQEQDIMLSRLALEREKMKARPPDARGLTPANVGRLYELGEISQSDALKRLTALNFPAAEADLFLRLYVPSKPKEEEPKEISASVIGGLFKQKRIDEAEARRLWSEAGYFEDDIVLLIAYYQPPVEVVKPPLPPRELTLAQVGYLFKEGYISESEALDRLERLRIRREDGAILLETIYAPKAPEEVAPKTVPVSMVGSLYREGKITRDVLEDAARAAGYDANAILMLVLYYEPKPEVPKLPAIAPELSPSVIGRLYKSGKILFAEAVNRLLALGWSGENAGLFLSLYAPE